VTAHAFRYRDSSFAADLKRNGPTHLVEGDLRATTALERDALLQIYLAPVDRPLAADDPVFGPVWVQQKLDDGGLSIYLLTVDSIGYLGTTCRPFFVLLGEHIAGLSAGVDSEFYQSAHDLYVCSPKCLKSLQLFTPPRSTPSDIRRFLEFAAIAARGIRHQSSNVEVSTLAGARAGFAPDSQLASDRPQRTRLLAASRPSVGAVPRLQGPAGRSTGR
jgi:hypothetical protein